MVSLRNELGIRDLSMRNEPWRDLGRTFLEERISGEGL